MGFFKAPDGAEIYFETELTEAAAPWVTFICGHTRTIHDYAYFREALAASGYNVLLFENRGSGRTRSPLEFTATEMIADLAGLWEHLTIKQTFLAGFSMGGYLALCVAANHPHRITGLILMSTSAWSDHVNERNDSWLTSMEGMEDKLASFFAPEFVRSNRGYMDKITELTIKAIEDGRFAARSAAQREAILGYNAAARLGQLRMPALVMHGDVDITIDPSAAKRLAAALPDARLQWIKGSAHFTPIEKPATVLGHMLAFLKEIACD